MKRLMIITACSALGVTAWLALGSGGGSVRGGRGPAAPDGHTPSHAPAPARPGTAEMTPMRDPWGRDPWRAQQVQFAEPASEQHSFESRVPLLLLAPESEIEMWREIQGAALRAGRLSWSPADWSMDGVLDARDAELFFTALEGRDKRADLNGDGRIDADDLAVFMHSYRAAEWRKVTILGC